MEKLRFKQMTFCLFIDENLQFQAKRSASLIKSLLNHNDILKYRNRKLSEIHMDV